MNIKFKRIIAICLSVLCLLSMTAFAEDTLDYKKAEDGSWPKPWEEQAEAGEKTENIEETEENTLKIPDAIEVEAGFLNALGMIPEGIIFEEDIKREEAATLIVKMLAKDDLAKSRSRFTYYEDVSMYSENVGYVNVVTEEGLFSGRSETVFDPKAPITYAELSKILVTATGYSAYAEKKGGFPAGYLTCANQLKILKDVILTGKTTVSWGDAVKMVYNAMNVDVLAGSEFTADGDDLAYVKTQGDNILKINHKLYKAEGQITGTALSKIFGTGLKRDLEYGEVEINSRLLSYDAEKLPDIETLIGYRTTYFYRETAEYEYELVYAFVEEGSSITVMSYDITDVYGFNPGENGTAYLEYFIDDLSMEDPEKLRIDKNAALIVNNEEVPRIANADLYPACGKVTLIDSDDDEVYDVLVVVNYEVEIVDVVSNYDKHIFFKNDPTTTPLVLNPIYTDVEYSITKDGRHLELRDLKEGDILGIVKSTKGRDPYYMIEVLSSCVEGTVEQIGSDEVIIDGKTYGVSPSFDLAAYDIRPGDYCKLYFDFAKELFYAEIEDDNYSFQYVLIGAEFKRGERKTVQAKMCPAIHGIYKEVKFFDFAEKVDINGKKCTGQAIIDALKLDTATQAMVNSEFIQPLRWVEFDEEEKITRIETVEEGPTSTREVREFFCSGVYNEKFGDYQLSYKTQICYIPNYRDDDTNWILGIGDQVRHGRTYDTLMWGTDEEGLPEAVFIFHSNRSSVEGYPLDYTRPMIIKDIKLKYDPDEQAEYYSVETLNSGANYLYISDDRNDNLECFKDLQPGDIIFSALTATRAEGTAAKVATILGGNIWSCERHIRLDDKNLSFYKASTNMYGRVKTVRVDPKVNKCTINIDLGNDDLGNPVEQSYEVTGVPIYYFDRGDKTVCLGTYAAAKSAEIYGEKEASNIFVYLDEDFDPNMIVIIGEK